MKKNLRLDFLRYYRFTLCQCFCWRNSNSFCSSTSLIVANAWDWGIVLSNFGWKAALGIITANTVYFFIFRSEFKKMEPHKDSDIPERVPFVITAVHILFIVWTVLTVIMSLYL